MESRRSFFQMLAGIAAAPAAAKVIEQLPSPKAPVAAGPAALVDRNALRHVANEIAGRIAKRLRDADVSCYVTPSWRDDQAGHIYRPNYYYRSPFAQYGSMVRHTAQLVYHPEGTVVYYARELQPIQFSECSFAAENAIADAMLKASKGRALYTAWPDDHIGQAVYGEQDGVRFRIVERRSKNWNAFLLDTLFGVAGPVRPGDLIQDDHGRIWKLTRSTMADPPRLLSINDARKILRSCDLSASPGCTLQVPGLMPGFLVVAHQFTMIKAPPRNYISPMEL